MKTRVLLAMATDIVFLIAVSTQDLRAAAAAHPSPAEKLHVVGKAELHDAVLSSSAEAAAARESVQGFLARPEVRNQIERMGFESAVIASRVALLSDSELQRLRAQVMAADQQNMTAGLIPAWVIVLITVVAVLAVLAIIGNLLDE